MKAMTAKPIHLRKLAAITEVKGKTLLSKNFIIMPFDEIFVRNSPGYQVQQSVTVTGEVLFEGEYVLSEKGQRLSDLVKKAGGINPDKIRINAAVLRFCRCGSQEQIQERIQILMRLTAVYSARQILLKGAFLL